LAQAIFPNSPSVNSLQALFSFRHLCCRGAHKFVIMGFDFDDLEEVAPAGLPETTAMSDEDFAGFRARIAKAEREQRFADFSAAIGEAVWDQELMPIRMPKIIEAFMSLLEEVTSRRMPDMASGGAIVYTLWMMSVSTSLHEVRVRKAESPESAPVALVLGFGGSDVVDLEFQAEFYQKKGFTVITTSKTGWPRSLLDKQNYLVAQELKSALTSGNNFVLHVCSQHGLMYGGAILNMWINKIIPFDSLPPITDHLKAFIIDSASPSKIDPEKKVLLYPTSLEEAEKAIAEAREPVVKEDEEEEDLGPESDDQLMKNQIKFYRSVMLGCTGAMSKKWGLMSIEEMVPKNKEIGKTFSIASRLTVAPAPWMLQAGAGLEAGSMEGADAFLNFQMMDWKLPTLPRLFLYSKADMLITSDMVEIYIRHMKKYRSDAQIFEKKLLKSSHCKNWEQEPEECAETVTNFFEAASVL